MHITHTRLIKIFCLFLPLEYIFTIYIFLEKVISSLDYSYFHSFNTFSGSLLWDRHWEYRMNTPSLNDSLVFGFQSIDHHQGFPFSLPTWFGLSLPWWLSVPQLLFKCRNVQSSVLGTFLFSIYTLLLSDICWGLLNVELSCWLLHGAPYSSVWCLWVKLNMTKIKPDLPLHKPAPSCLPQIIYRVESSIQKHALSIYSSLLCSLLKFLHIGFAYS